MIGGNQFRGILTPPSLIDRMVYGLSGTMGKLFMNHLQNTHIYNSENLINIIRSRSNRPLITIMNHPSTLDDPLVYASLLPLDLIFSSKFEQRRFSLGARELLFTNPLYKWFFHHGNVIPIDRGQGIDQEAIHKAINILHHGGWLSIFPEGRTTQTHKVQTNLFKRGTAYLVKNCHEKGTIPLIIPIYSRGMHLVRSNHQKGIKLFQNVDIICGDPIDTIKYRHFTMDQVTQDLASQLANLESYDSI